MSIAVRQFDASILQIRAVARVRGAADKVAAT
jgi:hypothetical protein